MFTGTWLCLYAVILLSGLVRLAYLYLRRGDERRSLIRASVAVSSLGFSPRGLEEFFEVTMSLANWAALFPGQAVSEYLLRRAVADLLWPHGVKLDGSEIVGCAGTPPAYIRFWVRVPYVPHPLRPEEA